MPSGMLSRTATRSLALLALLLIPAAAHAQGTGAMQDKDKMKKEADKMGKMDDKMSDKMSDKMGSGMSAMDDAKHANAIRGIGDHLASGSYAIAGSKGALRLTTSADFAHDPRATEVYVVLAKGSMVTPQNGLFLGKIAKASGANSLTIPADASLERFDTLVLWSKALNMAVGSARFDGATHARK